MRNLRKIFESLGFFKRSPVLSIKEMAARIKKSTSVVASLYEMVPAPRDERVTDLLSAYSSMADKDDIILFNRIIDAVVAIAEGDEDKASKKATATTEG